MTAPYRPPNTKWSVSGQIFNASMPAPSADRTLGPSVSAPSTPARKPMSLPSTAVRSRRIRSDTGTAAPRLGGTGHGAAGRITRADRTGAGAGAAAGDGAGDGSGDGFAPTEVR